MKAIIYVVAILVSGGAAYLSLDQSKKFETLEGARLETIDKNKKVTADSLVTNQKIKSERDLLNASKERQELMTQSVASLTDSSLSKELLRLTDDLKTQEEEFAQLNKALEEVNSILANLGGGVTLDTLPAKIQEIDDDKVAKQKKLEELEELASGASKTLATSRAEFDRLSKRLLERNSNIGMNSMEAVVTAVNQDWGFLVIGAGKNSGFTPQSTLLVERDGRMIGRVRPSSNEPTQTLAEIDFKSLPSGVRLQPGDRVILAKPTGN
jgi:hypothetical protein